MTVASESGVYYDPYDFAIDADPYPVWKRLRDEAPLYWNEKYEFFALSRWEDVDAAMLDWKTYISGRGSVLEIIKLHSSTARVDSEHGEVPTIIKVVASLFPVCVAGGMGKPLTDGCHRAIY